MTPDPADPASPSPAGPPGAAAPAAALVESATSSTPVGSASAALVGSARAAVLDAGALAMRYFRGSHASWEKGPGQIVTDADIAVDAMLHEALLALDPEAGWLSEESVDDGGRLERPASWIVDPIDGTRSFAKGLPEFTICVGYVVAGRPIFGFVLNPATGELFEAVARGGARLGERALRCTDMAGLDGARIVVSKYEERRRNFARLLPGTEIATIGSLALKLCLVADGRHDGYLTWRATHDWDIAAAVLILAEAGAVTTDAAGGAILLNRAVPRHRGLIVAGPALHEAILLATAEALSAREAGEVAPPPRGSGATS